MVQEHLQRLIAVVPRCYIVPRDVIFLRDIFIQNSQFKFLHVFVGAHKKTR